MKKRLVLAAGLGLSMAMLTACGTPKTEDLVDKMYESQMDSFTAEASFEVEVNVEGDDLDGDIKASGDMTMEVMNAQDTDKMLAHVDGSVKYDLLGFLDDKTDFEAYLDADEESAYYNTDGDWYVEDFNLSDSGVDKKLAGKIQEASKEFWYKGTVDKKLEEVSGEKAYVLTVEGTAADFMPVFDILADEVDEFEDLMDEADVDIKDIAKAVPVNVKAYVSKDNGYVLKTELDMAGIDIEAILDAADADLDDLGVDSIEVSALNFTITYSAVNETEVEVPSKVTKDAISYDDYGWGEDYDWDEDYNYGYEEDYDDDDYIPGGDMYYFSDEAESRMLDGFSFADADDINETIGNIENEYNGYEENSPWTFGELTAANPDYYEYDLSDNEYFSTLIDDYSLSSILYEVNYWSINSEDENLVLAFIAERYGLTELFIDCGADSDEIYAYQKKLLYNE